MALQPNARPFEPGDRVWWWYRKRGMTRAWKRYGVIRDISPDRIVVRVHELETEYRLITVQSIALSRLNHAKR